jgi:putative transposase
VVAPHLPTGEMVQRHTRPFGSQTARCMLTWSHGLFSTRLESAAFRWPGRLVLTKTGEPGTSKTCAQCGHWHAALGASKVFNCPVCGVCMDRDVAGARNNFFAAYGKAVGIGWDGLQH